MNFSDDVIKVSATALANITVHFSENNTQTNTERGWQNALRNGIHLTTIELKNWAIFFMARDEQKANALCHELISVAHPMGLRFEPAEM
jgi:hypothetical protein